MICVIRITGDVHLDSDVRETLHRLRLRRKYACVVLKGTQVEVGMIKKVSDFVAYGEIDEATLEKLVDSRAQVVASTKKSDTKTLVKGIVEGKPYNDLGIKPFFRLHPPRGGIDAKKHFGVKKGVLGNHKKDMNKLVEKML